MARELELTIVLRARQNRYIVVTRGDKLGKAIRTQRHHYTWWPTGEELYDLSQDPHEEINLASSSNHTKTLEAMRANLTSAEAIATSRSR